MRGNGPWRYGHKGKRSLSGITYIGFWLINKCTTENSDLHDYKKFCTTKILVLHDKKKFCTTKKKFCTTKNKILHD
jgi:hypothetical protein